MPFDVLFNYSYKWHLTVVLVQVTHQDGTTCLMENIFVTLVLITCIAGESAHGLFHNAAMIMLLLFHDLWPSVIISKCTYWFTLKPLCNNMHCNTCMLLEVFVWSLFIIYLMGSGMFHFLANIPVSWNSMNKENIFLKMQPHFWLKDVRANCFCASLLRTQMHTPRHTRARALSNKMRNDRAKGHCYSFARI